MGCIICNLLEIWGRQLDYEKCKVCAGVETTELDEQIVAELKEEICNDIAICHSDMVNRILVIKCAELMHKVVELTGPRICL